jgi:hypothetical protein
MVGLKEAYEIANDFFISNDYAGVAEVRDTGEKWLFMGKLKRATYGTCEVCVPKDGTAPHLFDINNEQYGEMWRSAKKVELK